MLNPLSFPWQIWESVPYLASYVSPVLKEGRSIPLLPRELEVAWNGKSRCATESRASPAHRLCHSRAAPAPGCRRPARG